MDRDTMSLVLSLFPGIGLLDRAFEEQGFCVVRGPDLLWGGDVRRFHPPAGIFDGVIGGPPCQLYCPVARLAELQGHAYENLIPEFERCVAEAKPAWFVMENVRTAPIPSVTGYQVHAQLVNLRWFGAEQNRERRISFGALERPTRLTLDGWAALESPEWAHAVSAAKTGERTRHGKKYPVRRYSVEEAIRLQGLPDDFLAKSPLTREGKLRAVANGVPLPLGRAVARAVANATGLSQ